MQVTSAHLMPESLPLGMHAKVESPSLLQLILRDTAAGVFLSRHFRV